jgi:hypothetical protein
MGGAPPVMDAENTTPFRPGEKNQRWSKMGRSRHLKVEDTVAVRKIDRIRVCSRRRFVFSFPERDEWVKATVESDQRFRQQLSVGTQREPFFFSHATRRKGDDLGVHSKNNHISVVNTQNHRHGTRLQNSTNFARFRSNVH